MFSSPGGIKRGLIVWVGLWDELFLRGGRLDGETPLLLLLNATIWAVTVCMYVCMYEGKGRED